MTLFTIAFSMASTIVGMNSHASDLGVILATADNGTGRVLLYLPDDMKAGDTISGSAFGQGTMTVSTVRVLGESARVHRNMFTIRIPNDAGSRASFTVSNASGDSLVEVSAPLSGGIESPMFLTPNIVSAGAPVKIAGPFDGKRANTMAEMNGTAVGILTESPRSCVVLASSGHVGATKFELLERRSYISSGMHTVSVALKMPNRVTVGRLAKAEVIVSGLSGLHQPDYPFFVKVDADEDLIKFERHGNQIEVTSDQVENGVFKGEIRFRVKKKGDFFMTARAVSGYDVGESSIISN